MCGLTGYWPPDGIGADATLAPVTVMDARLHHPGADDGGGWGDGEDGIAAWEGVERTLQAWRQQHGQWAT